MKVLVGNHALPSLLSGTIHRLSFL
jgi:hypothetical protein